MPKLTIETDVRPGEPAARDHAQAGEIAWFALAVRSMHEKAVAAALKGKGYEVFLPLYRSRRGWSDRVREIELPLFARYVFCRFDAQQRLPILTIPAVAFIVGIGKRPAAVRDDEIASLKAFVQSGLAAQPWPFVQIGQVVRIKEGPLRDIEGILVRIKNRSRLILSVTLLQRSVAVEINAAWVTPASRPIQSVSGSPACGCRRTAGLSPPARSSC